MNQNKAVLINVNSGLNRRLGWDPDVFCWVSFLYPTY